MKTSIHDLEGVSYAFMPLSRQIVFSGFAEHLSPSNIRGIINTDTNTLIYRIDKPGMGGSLSGDTLTLEYDTTAMGAGDDLSIVFDLPIPMKVVDEELNTQQEGIADILLRMTSILESRLKPMSIVESGTGRQSINVGSGSLTVSSVTSVQNMATLGGFQGWVFYKSSANLTRNNLSSNL